jgi:hypothetical protein
MTDFNFTVLKYHFQRETLALPVYVSNEYFGYTIYYENWHWRVKSTKPIKHKFVALCDAIKYCDYLVDNRRKAEVKRRSNGIPKKVKMDRKEYNKKYWKNYVDKRRKIS